MARGSDHVERPVTLAQAAEVLGMSEESLAELVIEAGVKQPAGPPGDWLLEAADVAAFAAERERRERLNRLELEKLSAALEGTDG